MAITKREGLEGQERRKRPATKWVWTRSRLGRELLVLLVAFGSLTGVVWAQVLPASAVVAAGETDTSAVRVLVGRSTVLDIGSPIARVSLTSADIADAMVTSPNQLLINGKMPGTISMFVWDRAGALRRYDVVVQRDLTRLSEQLHQLFPAENIDVQSNGKNVVLSGAVTNKDVIERAVNVAAGYVDKRDEVVALLQLRDGAPSNQVLLRVRFAEVSRSALTELGASLFTGPTGVKNTLGRVTTQQFNAPGFDGVEYSKAGSDFGGAVTSAKGQVTFGDFLNLFLFSEKFDLGAMVRLLQSKGVFQSLAEPNLVSESGKEASFLAGGEFPVPIAQGSGNNMAISIMFKEFGIRLTFTPTVTGNRVHLKVRPEVSTLDFANGVVLNGFRIPALSTRRTETELELQDGQTFAIAGLLSNSVSSTLQKVPGVGDIPILGALFKSKAAQKNQTELVVMITPEILPNNSTGVTPSLPRTPEPFLPALPNNQSVAPAQPAFRQQGTAAAAPAMNAPGTPVATTPVSGAGQSVVAAQPVAAQSPAAAASAVQALTPSGPRPMDPPAAATVASATKPAPQAARPVSEKEQKEIDRARLDEQKKAADRAREQSKVDERTKAGDATRQAKDAEIARVNAAKEHEQQEKLAREQSKRDAETAKRAIEATRKQEYADRKRQQAIADANDQIKAAEAAYNSELAQQNKK